MSNANVFRKLGCRETPVRTGNDNLNLFFYIQRLLPPRMLRALIMHDDMALSDFRSNPLPVTISHIIISYIVTRRALLCCEIDYCIYCDTANRVA